MTIKIGCLGISDDEGRELQKFLADLEGVEWARIAYADDALDLGRLQASAREMHVLVDLAIGAGSSVGVTMMNEATKDVYKAAKASIMHRLQAWKEARIPEERQQRVEFELNDQHELVIR